MRGRKAKGVTKTRGQSAQVAGRDRHLSKKQPNPTGQDGPHSHRCSEPTTSNNSTSSKQSLVPILQGVTSP